MEQFIQKQPNLCEVQGDITFDSVIKIEVEGLSIIPLSKSPLVINFSQVQHVSSVAVALLLSWMRCAERQGIQLQFTGLSERFKAILAVSDVLELIDPR